MEYIFNVKAQFEQKKEYNIEAQFEAIKKNIEGQVIHVQAKIDPNSLSLAKIQEQLKNEKLTLNVGNVTFKDTGLDNVKTEIQQVASATENVTQQTQQAKQAVQQLVSEYKKLSIEDVNKEFSSNGKLSTSLGISQESLDTQKTIDAMRELKQQYESVWGKGMVDITARTETSTHAINGFTIAVKNAENQIYKFRYSANQNKDTGLWSFDYSGSTFADSAIQKTKEQTKELQNQEKEYQRLTDIVNKAYANATNTSTNSNAIQNVENIKLLRTQYDTVIEALNRLKNSTADTFEENKKAAQQAIQGFQDYSKVLQNTEQSIKATDEAIKKLEQNTQKGFFANNANDSNVAKLKQDVDGLRNTYIQLQSQFQSQGSTAQVIQGFATLDERIKSVSQTAVDLQQNLRQTNTELSLTGQKSNLNNRIETWLKNNTKASGTTVQALKQLQAQIQSADKESLKNLTQQFKDITKNAELAGEAGKSFLDSINEKVGKFTSWFSISQIIMGITNEVKQAIVTFKEMDTILTEISKTSERSAESLAKLGESAFDTASKYGVSVQNYLTGVQEMARAGYEIYGEDRSAELAELALLVQSAGDTTAQVAQEAIIATDAAFQLGGNVEELTEIFNGFNKITNNTAINMNDMAIGIKEAASIAHQYDVSIEDTASLIAIAEARTKQGGAQVGNAVKSLLLNLNDITNKQIVKAFDYVGVSMYKMVDGSKKLKTPIELLGELSDVFNSLPQGDDKRAYILSEIGGMQIYHYVQKCA